MFICRLSRHQFEQEQQQTTQQTRRDGEEKGSERDVHRAGREVEGEQGQTSSLNVCLFFGSLKSASLGANMNKADLRDFVCRINQEPIIMLIVVVAGNFHHAVGCCICRVGCCPLSVLNLPLNLLLNKAPLFF
jgi:hypothetical protein